MTVDIITGRTLLMVACLLLPVRDTQPICSRWRVSREMTRDMFVNSCMQIASSNLPNQIVLIVLSIVDRKGNILTCY